MCLIWTQKYHLCGCIWNTRDLYCEPSETCWGARMVVINCQLQTCKECWKSGDKRVDQEVANLLSEQQEAKRHRRGQDLEDAEKQLQGEVDSDCDPSAEEEDFEALQQSRPATPELDLDPRKMPRWLFGADVMGDATRACEPVKPGNDLEELSGSQEKTDWYLIEDLLGKWLGPTVSSGGDEEPSGS